MASSWRDPTRTFLIDPNDLPSKACEVLYKAHEAAIKELKPGNKACTAYEAAVSVVKKEAPELSCKMTTNTRPGVIFESVLDLNGQNEQLVKEGEVFNVSLGFENLQYSKGKRISMWLADTVTVQSVIPEVLTAECSKTNDNIKLPLADNGGERQPEFMIFDDDDVEICKKQKRTEMEVLKECVDGVGNRTPEAEAPTHHSPTLIQLFPNLSHQLPRQGVPNGRLIRIQFWPPPPPRDDYRATVRYIEYARSQLKNGIVSQQMVDSARETVRRLRSKGYSNLDEDEAITLKDSIHFLGRLESTPSFFRERFLKFAEDIPSRVRCLRQMQETLIDQPNLVEQERQCIAEIQNRMQARALRNQQLDEEEVTVTCERAKREEEKEVLITRLEDIRRNVTETSTALSYIDGGRI